MDEAGSGLSGIKAVLIDLDGTLMDTVPDLAAAANRMRHEHGLPPLPVERIAQFIGKGADVLIHRALTDDLIGRVDEDIQTRARLSYYRHYHEINGMEAVVYDGVPEALQRLRETGAKLSCVTNKPREFTLPLLDRSGLAEWFEVVVAGDDVKEPKPHPALLLLACKRLDISPGSALMIGDSINDAQAAHAAGMRVLLVETGYNEGESLETLKGEPGVEAIVPTLLYAAEFISERISKTP
jgi:phosphoglycolate phosphatase